MARPPRLHVPGGFYHVTLRGNHRQPIFFCHEDRARLDGIVAEALRTFSARLHAYCWMTNHLHALVQVADAPLGRLVQRIASRYARRAQAAIQTTGHLFERRYHAVVVDADAYLLTLLRYIHLNPVRGGLVAQPGDYPWSSHHEYLGTRRQSWVTTATALGVLSPRLEDSRSKYRALMGQPGDLRWGDEQLRPHPDNDQVLGDDAFLARLVAAEPKEKESGTLDDLKAECLRRFDLTPEELDSPLRTRRLSAARAWLSSEATRHHGATIAEIARKLKRTESAVRRLMGRHRRLDA
jgi:REP element-mobilizing transposase RayT